MTKLEHDMFKIFSDRLIYCLLYFIFGVKYILAFIQDLLFHNIFI